MTPELLKTLARYPQFPTTAHDLVRIVGWEGAAQLITHWRGQEWPVPMRSGGATPQGVRRYEQLRELVGDSAARRVVQNWGGQRLYVPNLKEVRAAWAADNIRADFDRLTTKEGYSSPEAVFELGLKYDLSGRAVENALAAPNSVLAGVELQGELF